MLAMLDHEGSVRLGVMAAWEVVAPCRRREIPRLLRWSSNLGAGVLDTVLVRLAFPVLAVALALQAEAGGWGLFNALDVPFWLAFVASVLLLDLAIYLQHVMLHAIPSLWRLHRMHHADLEFDAPPGCASTRSRSCCRWASSWRWWRP